MTSILFLVESETSRFKHIFELDNFPFGWIRNKLVSSTNTRFLWTRIRCTCYIVTKGIYNFYILFVILKVLLNIFFYAHIFSHLIELVIYRFTRLRKLLMNYFYIISQYYHTNEDGGVLEYPVQNHQHNITLRESQMILIL